MLRISFGSNFHTKLRFTKNNIKVAFYGFLAPLNPIILSLIVNLWFWDQILSSSKKLTTT
jgi:hypothetical protein